MAHFCPLGLEIRVSFKHSPRRAGGHPNYAELFVFNPVPVLLSAVQMSNALIFTYSPPSISSLSPGIIPTVGLAQAELLGDSFGSCAGQLGCFLRVTVTFPPYSIMVDMSDRVRSRCIHLHCLSTLLLSPCGV